MALSDEELDRYARHLVLRQVGGPGQAKIRAASVLVVGASGSGKSSTVKAGLLPDLKLQGMIGRVALVRHAVVRPADGEGDLPSQRQPQLG